ncbi:hypothetical protein [Rhodococcus sp. OK302]|uniref:hypothetical protein n=1 Tax=Rhodococcus sp. OK302 TaxID=1882769 RepID=UPI0020CBB240|nr:hypothetical protein [Rhodococcus sp. OK302]
MAEIYPPLTQRDLTLSIASELGTAGFEEAHEIGRGGFSVIYRCRHRSLDHTVAVKILTSRSGPENLKRFLREQRATAQWRNGATAGLSGHPNLVTSSGSAPPLRSARHHDGVSPHGSLEARTACAARSSGAKRSASGSMWPTRSRPRIGSAPSNAM